MPAHREWGDASRIASPAAIMWQLVPGGRGGIRTHGELAPSPVFKTGSLNHSDTLPAAPFAEKESMCLPGGAGGFLAKAG